MSKVDEMPTLIPHGTGLMQGFERRRIKTSGADIEIAVGGNGPPLLLRHTCEGRGHAQTVCSACGEPLDIGSVRAKAGPGFRPATPV